MTIPFEEFIETRGLAQSSQREYRQSMRLLGGRVDLATFGHRDLLQARAEMRTAGLSDSTVAKHMRHGSMVIQWAIRCGYREGPNPFDGVAKTARPPEPDRYVTIEELDRIMLACPNAAYANAFAIARLAGLRINEIRRLWSRHIDTDRNIIMVRPEKETTKQSRRDVPMSPDLRCRLTLIPGEQLCENLGSGLYRSGHPHSARHIIQSAGVELYKKPFHNLRASAERDWYDQGFSVMDVCHWMGHGPEVSKRHYTRPTPGAMARATGQLQESAS